MQGNALAPRPARPPVPRARVRPAPARNAIAKKVAASTASASIQRKLNPRKTEAEITEPTRGGYTSGIPNENTYIDNFNSRFHEVFKIHTLHFFCQQPYHVILDRCSQTLSEEKL
jgi:hypothetical protein